MPLPERIDPRAFDELHDEPARWREVVASIAAEHSAAPMRPASEGTVLVGLVGDEIVVKLYPPFLRDHFVFEQAMLARLHGRLSVPTPRLLASGEREGWPYLVMTQLAGEPMTRAWPLLPEREKCRVLAAIGRLAAEVHALPVGSQAALAPEWPAFLSGQRARCWQRQQRTGLPAHLLDRVQAFVAGPVPEGPAVLLTGEYTPMNLLHGGAGAEAGLAGMYDFGDGLVGPREYDWLGPLSFLAAGHAARCDAFMDGYGAGAWRPQRQALLRMLLLHRYSHLPVQLASCPGWDQAPSFEALAEAIWP
ncbi:MAG: phosphotransferase [Burkholderiaceae bacterium]